MKWLNNLSLLYLCIFISFMPIFNLLNFEKVKAQVTNATSSYIQPTLEMYNEVSRDITTPTGSIEINNGDEETTNTNLNIRLNAEDIIEFFIDSKYYKNEHIDSVTIFDLKIGNCSNISRRQLYKVRLKGYVAESLDLIFVDNGKGVFKHCSTIPALDKSDYPVD